MKRAVPLIFIVALAACGSPKTETILTSTETVIPPTETAPPSAETAEPAETAAPENILDAQGSFAVIAAVNEHILMIEEWLGAEVSLNERQAILYPQLEIGLEALSEVYLNYRPHPGLGEEWTLAEAILEEVTTLSLRWASGEIAEQDFRPEFEEMAARSSESTLRAAALMEDLGVAPGSADPMGTVYGLLSDPTPAVLPEETGDTPPPSLNTEIAPVQVVPFIYPFAGMDVFIVIGLVENAGAQSQEAVTVSIRFYNLLDEHLGTSTGQILTGTLLPGGMSPFMATTVTEGEEAALQDWTRYEVEIVSRPAEESYQSFEIALTSVKRGGNGSYHLTGEVTNAGGQTVRPEAVRVSVAAYDEAGNLVGVGEGYLPDEGNLAPGDAAAFQAVIEAVSAEPADFQFFAEVIE